MLTPSESHAGPAKPRHTAADAVECIEDGAVTRRTRSRSRRAEPWRRRMDRGRVRKLVSSMSTAVDPVCANGDDRARHRRPCVEEPDDRRNRRTVREEPSPPRSVWYSTGAPAAQPAACPSGGGDERTVPLLPRSRPRPARRPAPDVRARSLLHQSPARAAGNCRRAATAHHPPLPPLVRQSPRRARAAPYRSPTSHARPAPGTRRRRPPRAGSIRAFLPAAGRARTRRRGCTRATPHGPRDRADRRRVSRSDGRRAVPCRRPSAHH